MRKIIQRTISLAFLVSPLISPAHGQATPAAVAAAPYRGFELPKVKGSLQYAASAAETLTKGYYQTAGNSNVAEFTSISGDVAYLSSSSIHPLSLVYSGGFLGSNSGQPSTFFQNFALSQVLTRRAWNFIVSDSLSYLPNTPSVGLSGIPGVGDLGAPPIQIGPVSGQGVLTGNASRISNVTVVSVERLLTGKTSVQASGSFLLQRFTGNSGKNGFGIGQGGLNSGNGGLDSNQITATFGPNHRIDARDAVSANYAYSRFTYASNQFGFITQGVNFGYTRQLTRKYSSAFSIGPQRTSSSNAALSQASTNLAASAGLFYTGETTSGSLSYVRGVNNGSGVIQGARSDSIGVNGHRMLGRVWSTGLSSSYTHTTSLPFFNIPPFSTQTVVAGVQVSRSISRSFATYASYTVQKQSIQGSGATLDVFSGLSQVVGIGLTYAPGSRHFGRL